MRCPNCSSVETSVLDSRVTDYVVRRRRECTACSKRFTTYEKAAAPDMSIVKRDGRRELFSREKLIRGILKACEKRPVKREKIEAAADDIELTVRQGGKLEVPSKRIGELVVDRLQHLDQVAYVRFASVYRRFTDVKQFADEIKKLNKQNNRKLVAEVKIR